MRVLIALVLTISVLSAGITARAGMPVTDPRGKVIGHVQELRQSSRGVVQAVTVEVSNRVATLPAASFTGSGDVLVSAMTKGQVKKAAEQQGASK